MKVIATNKYKIKNEISNTVLLVIKEYKVTVDFVWLKRIEQYLLDNDGSDLYCLLEVMYREQKMNFRQFIYDASRGIGCFVSEGLGYVLDQDMDDPTEFKEVTFFLGDYESLTLSPEKFIELMQIISNSYIDKRPYDKVSVKQSLVRLKERYQKPSLS
ncbi:hypothetical protein NAG84_01910 [Proteus terrae]|uniref:hypothetical protein n=1 Tax=Proteus terrae TaxID=1574161 RepID=UPI00209545C8|nr:hypothetical protein [Proteus terrae]MCO7048605.1 hypothetical protein [Proteus terrae]